MRRWRILAAAAAVCLILSGSAAAATPAMQFPYSKQTSLAAGKYKFVFSLYASPTDPNPLWTSEKVPLVLRTPLLLYTLGSGTVKVPNTIDFSQQLYLKVDKVYPAPRAVVANREPLPIAPYAAALSPVGGGVPSGGIIMWSGSTPPAGWVLCDGKTYPRPDGSFVKAPDLRDRFVVGQGSQFGPGKFMGPTGGEMSHALTMDEMPSHTHAVDPPSTASFGQSRSHNHKLYMARSDSEGSGYGLTAGPVGFADRVLVWSDAVNWMETSADASQDHSHSVDIGQFDSGTAGAGAAHSNLPPYYALGFIMKL